MFVLLYEDIKTDPVAVSKQLFEWVGVSPIVVEGLSRKANKSVPTVLQRVYERSRLLQFVRATNLGRRGSDYLLGLLPKRGGRSLSQADSQALTSLRQTYREDTLELQEILQRSLLHWKPLRGIDE
ncbi:hypothetical protein [Planctomycetes bacterium SV_7m_r]|uniref:hypothetical protein n=1 Tax=Stieleria bergensis TaxID=2528025 RepID=UPI00119CBFB4